MIYLDLDGVFADFRGYMDKNIPGWNEMTKDELWETTGEIDNFFYQLRPFKEALPLFNYLYDNYHCEVLTAMPRKAGKLTSARRDKVEWVRENLSGSSRPIQVHCVDSRRDKRHMCFDEWDVLIDDHVGNIELWRNAGGVGILHTSVEETFAQINELEKAGWLQPNLR